MPGYGRCVYRCFQEALAEESADLIVLCEGDMTFRAKDLEKLLAYIDEADIVNGTRIVEQLRYSHSFRRSCITAISSSEAARLKHLGRALSPTWGLPDSRGQEALNG